MQLAGDRVLVKSCSAFRPRDFNVRQTCVSALRNNRPFFSNDFVYLKTKFTNLESLLISSVSDDTFTMMHSEVTGIAEVRTVLNLSSN